MVDRSDYESQIQSHFDPLTAPRVTPDDVQAAIAAEHYHVPPGTTLTICVLTLQNGFVVTGGAAAADPRNFRKDLGQQFARKDAESKIWPLLGYALKERLAQS